MLRALSGKEHQVFTAVAMFADGKTATRLSVSEVKMRPLGKALIERYWQTGEPEGKAGGYAIQGRAAAFIPRINGSYPNVVGLPLTETLALLTGLGYAPPDAGP
jgi:septum formation protein